MQVLAPKAYVKRLSDLNPCWSLAGGKLHTELDLADFAFLTCVAALAEERNHRPDGSKTRTTAS